MLVRDLIQHEREGCVPRRNDRDRTLHNRRPVAVAQVPPLPQRLQRRNDGRPALVSLGLEINE